jgi:hypothetical protein
MTEDLVLGARVSMRGAARQILEAIDQLAEFEVARTGWTREDIALLERIAAWKIEGVPFGEWPVP